MFYSLLLEASICPPFFLLFADYFFNTLNSVSQTFDYFKFSYNFAHFSNRELQGAQNFQSHPLSFIYGLHTGICCCRRQGGAGSRIPEPLSGNPGPDRIPVFFFSRIRELTFPKRSPCSLS